MERLTDRLDMTIAVDWDVNPLIKQSSNIGRRDFQMHFIPQAMVYLKVKFIYEKKVKIQFHFAKVLHKASI